MKRVSKLYPVRTFQHVINDKGTALFHYLIAGFFATRSVLSNDYGIDEILDTVEYSPYLRNNDRFLPGKLFGVQVKSSISNKKSQSIRIETAKYLYNNTLITFIVFVDIKAQKFKFTNVRRFIRENYEKYMNQSTRALSFSLSDTSNYGDKEDYRSYFMEKTSNDVSKVEEILTNLSLYFEFEYEVNRPELELLVLDLIKNLKSNMDIFTKLVNSDSSIPVNYDSYENLYTEDLITNIATLFSLMKLKNNDLLFDVEHTYESYLFKRMSDRNAIYSYEDNLRHLTNVLLNYRQAFICIKELVEIEKSYWKSKYPLVIYVVSKNFDDYLTTDLKQKINLNNPPYENLPMQDYIKKEQERVERDILKRNLR